MNLLGRDLCRFFCGIRIKFVLSILKLGQHRGALRQADVLKVNLTEVLGGHQLARGWSRNDRAGCLRCLV